MAEPSSASQDPRFDALAQGRAKLQARQEALINQWAGSQDFYVQQAQRNFHNANEWQPDGFSMGVNPERFQEAITTLHSRNEWLADPQNTIAQINERSERLAAVAGEALQQAPVIDWRHTAMDDMPEYETEAWDRDDGEADDPTHYAGMMGSAPARLEIDTSDPDMGQGWQATLAALDARLEALLHDAPGQEPHHAQNQGREW
jgi:hypothetical protein